MKIQELLDHYYQALARKSGWETVLAEDFRFIGGDMTKQAPAVGLENYSRVLQGLSRLYNGLTVVKSFIDREEAFLLVSYDWTFPKGVDITGAVAEYWKVKDGLLGELTIFFDTGTFDRLARG